MSESTKVVNLRKEDYDVYIGRKGRGKDGYFGNPFSLREYGATSMGRYRDYFLRRVNSDPDFRARVLELKGKRLGCFCAPSVCHGDVIVEWLGDQEVNCD